MFEMSHKQQMKSGGGFYGSMAVVFVCCFLMQFKCLAEVNENMII